MNRLFTFLIFFFGILHFTFSQIPQQFNFQGVARDNGTVITGNVSLQISLHQSSPTGPVVFRERHFPVTNNAGVFNVLVGQGLPVTGTISSIDWTNGPFFLQTELDPTGGLSFTDMGTTPFSSVPYALYAREAEIDAVQDADADPTNEIQQLSFNAASNQLSISNGNTVTLPSGGADPDPTNEIQILSQNGNLVTLSLGGGTVNIDDADHNSSNELQSLSKAGNQVTLSNGGGSVSIDDADSNPNNELQNLNWNAATNILGISAGNTVDLSSLASTPGLWQVDPFGIYYDQGDAYIGSPNGFPALHLAPTFLDFHTGDNYYSYLDRNVLEIHGEVFANTMTNNLVRIEGAWIDSYWNNRIDSTGFYADYWGLFPGQSVQDAFGFEVRPDIGVTTSFGRLQTDHLEIRDMNTHALLEKDKLTFAVDGLGPFAQLSGMGGGEIHLYSGANWLNVFTGGTNYGGDLQLYDPSGKTNVILGYDYSGNASTGSLSLYDPNDNQYIYLGMGVSGTGGLWSDGPNGYLNTMVTNYSSYPNHGYVGVCDASGNEQAGMYVDGYGNGILWADGASGGVKSFVLPHPERSDTDIWYASLEGPEAAAYERGVATLNNGTVFVPFSDHFRVVANTETMTVILTPHSIDTYGLAVVSKTENGFTVRELKGETGNFSFDWEAKCVRKGWESWQVEREHNSHRAGEKPNQSSRREHH